MPFTTNPYCTVQQVYSALDLSSSSQTNDGAWIQELIEEAQGAIDRYLGFSFQTDGTVPSPASRVYDGNDGPMLYLPGDRIISISQVLETTYNVYLSSQGVFVSGTTQTVDITADVVLGPPNNSYKGYFYIKRKTAGAVFTQGNSNYQVSGVFGRPSIPADITRACVRVVVTWYKMRDTNYADQIAEQGGLKQKYSKVLPLDVREILDDYKPRRYYA